MLIQKMEFGKSYKALNISCLKLSIHFCWVYLYNKRVCPTKNEPQQGISYLERARERGERERGVGGQVSRQSYLGLGLGETERQR
jgi:hypothetical protein